MQALERKKLVDEACGQIDTVHSGYLGAQDTFHVGTLKDVGGIYQQTYVDTYCKVARSKLYTTKTPITAADLLNDPVLRILNIKGLLRVDFLPDSVTTRLATELAERYKFVKFPPIDLK